MAAIDELIQQIENPELRERISAEVKRANKQKKFGLVFEEHMPECTPLYDVPVKRGSLVAKHGEIKTTYRVFNIEDGRAYCIEKSSNKHEEIPVEDLVCVVEFGEPIYPYLKPLDSVCNACDSDLWHTLIEADNYHALQLLDYMYHGKVDCIYIDPPYNSGAKDWKYNNDYVDGNDRYRHSKWLAFMERRLRLAKKLLNPQNSVLLITIDEREFARLSLLLEQLFPEAQIQMVSITINPSGAVRENLFARSDEYMFVVLMGDAHVTQKRGNGEETEVRWWYLRRLEYASRRGTVKGGAAQFYPIYIDNKTNKIVEIGDPIPPEQDRHTVPQIEGTTTIFPVRDDGVEMNWGVTKRTLKTLMDEKVIQVLKNEKSVYQPYTIKYLSENYKEKIEDGRWAVRGLRDDGSKIVVETGGKLTRTTTVWKDKQYDAKTYGTLVLKNIVGNDKFSFPKSLYSVHDALTYFISEKPDALVVDFFAGSGTTLNAVNLMNAEDGGNRRCILVTNNEVGPKTAESLQKKGLKPGNPEWEKEGICQAVTWPRTQNSILGRKEDGSLLDGEYITSIYENIPIKKKIEQINFFPAKSKKDEKRSLVSFLKDDDGKSLFAKSLVENDDTSYIIAENSSATILFDTDQYNDWMDELSASETIKYYYIVTGDSKEFKRISNAIKEELPSLTEKIQIKKKMQDGFYANAQFFKLEFLDKSLVALGTQLQKLIPVIWMKAGAVGECPLVDEVDKMLVFPKNKFAILIDTKYTYEFMQEVAANDIQVAYIVTDYEPEYREIANGLSIPATYHLYRDYLDNFSINTERV